MRKHFPTIVASILLGFLIWALSPSLLGEAEPWDSPYPFYSIVLFSGGALIALLNGKSHPLCGPGVWLGQVIALCTLPGIDRGWIMLGIFTTALGSLFAVLGNVIIGLIGAFLRWLQQQHSSK